jgi:hypothetical protein
MPARLPLDTVLGRAGRAAEEVSRMLRWTARMLIAAIASLMVVWACGAAAGALAAGTGGGAVVQRSGDPAPVVIPSPELVGVPLSDGRPPSLRLE